MPKRLNDRIKKNLLDLEYNKYLQHFNTSMILLFTYVIGLFVASITKQIDYTNPKQLLLVAPISIVFIVIVVISLLNSRSNLTKIPKEMKKLKL